MHWTLEIAGLHCTVTMCPLLMGSGPWFYAIMAQQQLLQQATRMSSMLACTMAAVSSLCTMLQLWWMKDMHH